MASRIIWPLNNTIALSVCPLHQDLGGQWGFPYKSSEDKETGHLIQFKVKLHDLQIWVIQNRHKDHF